MAYRASEVHNVCETHNMHVSKRDGEWRICPNEYQNRPTGERMAYYTDDNEDAICTAIRWRRNLTHPKPLFIKSA